MPTYEYECAKCRARFDIFHSMTEEPDVKCPSCKGKAERLISAGSGIIFKGSGFYETDYKRKRPDSKPGSSPCAKGSPACNGCSLNKEAK